LLGIWDGRIGEEYGRWRTEKECHDFAEQVVGLPAGADYTLGGKTFRLIVRRR
jgi:hypothetical protein